MKTASQNVCPWCGAKTDGIFSAGGDSKSQLIEDSKSSRVTQIVPGVSDVPRDIARKPTSNIKIGRASWRARYSGQGVVPKKRKMIDPEEVQESQAQEGKAFSGTIRDRLGRKRCYRNGFPVACSQGGGGEDRKAPEAPSQDSGAIQDEDGDSESQASQEGGEEAAATPVEVDWQEAVSSNLEEIENNDLSDYPYSEEELAAEKSWHGEFMEWMATNIPTEVDAASMMRFITGLLNPAMGGIPYIEGLAKQFGISMEETSFTYILFHGFKWMLDDVELGDTVSKLAGNLLGESVGEIFEAIPHKEEPPQPAEEPVQGLRGLRRLGGRFSNLVPSELGDRLQRSHAIRKERKLRLIVEVDPETEECECEEDRGIPQKYGRTGHKAMSIYNQLSGGALVGMPQRRLKTPFVKRSVLNSLFT